MDVGLEKELYSKYPKIFSDISLPGHESRMAWGIECGNGWYWLIDLLCSNIMAFHLGNDLPIPAFTQVKEKFGSLRVYSDDASEYCDGLIDMACAISTKICETCGNSGKFRVENNWCRTECEDCREKRLSDKQ